MTVAQLPFVLGTKFKQSPKEEKKSFMGILSV